MRQVDQLGALLRSGALGGNPGSQGVESVYLGLAMDERATLRMKPQNLLFNLPLRATN